MSTFDPMQHPPDVEAPDALAGGPPQPQAIETSPVATRTVTGAAQAVNGQWFVMLGVSTPVGAFTFFLSPEHAENLAAELMQKSALTGAAASPLVVAQSMPGQYL